MAPAALRRSRSSLARQQQQDRKLKVNSANNSTPPSPTMPSPTAGVMASDSTNAARTVYQSRAGLIMVHVTLVPIMVASAAAALLFARHFGRSPLTTLLSTWAFVLPFYAVVWLSWIYPFYVSELRHVPTVPGFPLWGHVYTLVTEECGSPQRAWHRDHGPIVRYFLPLGAERLSIAGDDALKRVLLRNPYNYPKPLRVREWMGRVLGNGVLLAEGAEHVHQRKVLAPAFSPSSIRALMPVFWEKALLMCNYWEEEIQDSGAPVTGGKHKGSKSKPIEVQNWMNRCTLDIIGKAMFGTDIDSLRQPENPLRQAYRLVFSFDMTSRILHVVNAFIPSSRYLPSKMNRDIEKSRDIILDKATEIIRSKYEDADEDSEKHGSEGGAEDQGYARGIRQKAKDTISLIARASRKLESEGEPGLSFETTRDQIMTFLGAGHDTTAASVSWTLHILSKHQDVQARLRDEIRQRIPALFDRSNDGASDEDALVRRTAALASMDPDQLPYLQNVCRESLRYLPPIPLTVRQSVEADTFSGYHIPGGTPVYIFPSVVNRLPAYWGATADQFDPDRWDQPVSKRAATSTEGAAEVAATAPPPNTRSVSNGSSSGFMTFLQGPRGCIGRKFAETEIKVLLCVLLSTFEFSRDETRQDPEETKYWRLVIRPKDGMYIKVTRLSQ